MANPNIINVTSIYGVSDYLIPSLASLTGSIATTVLTVTAVASGKIAPNHFITGTGITTNTRVTNQLTAVTAVVTATGTASSGSSTLALTSYTVGTVAAIAVGQFVQPISGIPVNTYVTAINTTTSTITISNATTGAVSGALSLYTAGQTGTYTVSSTQTVASTAISLGNAVWTTLTPAAGTIHKIDNIVAANVTGTAATVTVAINSAATGSGTNHRLVYQLPVPANAAVIVVDKSTSFYLGEAQSVTVTVGTASAVELTASYEAIT